MNAFDDGRAAAEEMFGVKIADALARAVQRGVVTPSVQNAARLKAQFPTTARMTPSTVQDTLHGMQAPPSKAQDAHLQVLRKNLRESQDTVSGPMEVIQQRGTGPRMREITGPTLTAHYAPLPMATTGGASYQPGAGAPVLRVTPEIERRLAYQTEAGKPTETLQRRIQQQQVTDTGVIGVNPRLPKHVHRPALEHEIGERWHAEQALRGKPITPYAGHYGPEATVRELGAAATSPKSWHTSVSDRTSPDAALSDQQFMKHYTHVGGTRGAPVLPDSRQSRAIQQKFDQEFARTPQQLAAKQMPEGRLDDLRAARTYALQGMPLTPGVEAALAHPSIQARLNRTVPKRVIQDVARQGPSEAGPLGFRKLSVVDDPREEQTDPPAEESHLLRNLGMAGAMAAPWGGTIGEQKLIHEGKGVDTRSLAEFRKHFRPGDIILQGDEAIEPFKVFSGISTGQPKALHVEVVGRKNQMYGAGGSGMQAAPIKEFTPTHSRLQLLRPKMTPGEVTEQMRNMEQGLRTTSTFEKHLTHALDARGHDADQIEKLLRVTGNGTYNTYEAAGTALKNLFVPKLRSEAAAEAAKQQTVEARRAFNRNQGGFAKDVAEDGVARLDRFHPLRKVPQSAALFQSQIAPACVGSICSTFPAQALPQGKNVVPGKLPSEVMGSDYLRSNMYEPVARHGFGTPDPFHETLLKHGPLAARLGVGAALAGSVYGGSKLLGWYQQRQRRQTQADDKPAYQKGAEDASRLFA